MSFTLSGPIAAIKAQLVTLLNRITQTIADRLDVDISSRAPSSTALSDAVWTGAKAGFLNSSLSVIKTVIDAIKSTVDTNLDAKVSEAGGYPIYNSLARTIQGVDLLKEILQDTAQNKAEIGGGFTYGGTGALTSSYVTKFTLTGPGVLDFLAIHKVAGTLVSTKSAKIILDGVTVFDQGIFGDSDTGHGAIVIGLCPNDGAGNIDGGLSFENIAFKTSFVLQLKSTSGSDTDDVDWMYRVKYQ